MGTKDEYPILVLSNRCALQSLFLSKGKTVLIMTAVVDHVAGNMRMPLSQGWLYSLDACATVADSAIFRSRSDEPHFDSFPAAS